MIMDTETNGLIGNEIRNSKYALAWWNEGIKYYPYLHTIAWKKVNWETKEVIFNKHFLVKPIDESGNEITPYEPGLKDMGLSMEDLRTRGYHPSEALTFYIYDAEDADLIVGHNSNSFDIQLIIANAIRFGVSGKDVNNRRAYNCQHKDKRYDTMKDPRVQDYVGIKSKNGKNKWPTMTELYKRCFGEEASFAAHDAMNDVNALTECIFNMEDNNIIKL